MMLRRMIRIIMEGRLWSLLRCRCKGRYYTWRYVDGGKGRIVCDVPWVRLCIRKQKSARILLNGDLHLTVHCNGRGPVSLEMMDNARLVVDGDFGLGQNCKIHVAREAELFLGGQRKESASGMTCDSMIMCYHEVHIGYDLICGWNVYISDSDWHTTLKNGEMQGHYAPVVIGNHVWIGSNVLIGKGVELGNDVVVGAYSKVTKCKVAAGVTVAGLPAREVTTSLTWTRDIV